MKATTTTLTVDTDFCVSQPKNLKQDQISSPLVLVYEETRNKKELEILGNDESVQQTQSRIKRDNPFFLDLNEGEDRDKELVTKQSKQLCARLPLFQYPHGMLEPPSPSEVYFVVHEALRKTKVVIDRELSDQSFDDEHVDNNEKDIFGDDYSVCSGSISSELEILESLSDELCKDITEAEEEWRLGYKRPVNYRINSQQESPLLLPNANKMAFFLEDSADSTEVLSDIEDEPEQGDGSMFFGELCTWKAPVVSEAICRDTKIHSACSVIEELNGFQVHPGGIGSQRLICSPDTLVLCLAQNQCVSRDVCSMILRLLLHCRPSGKACFS